MIELGLARVTRLLRDTPLTWRAIHVAGTNGKGSVCAYASAILRANKIRCGRFTSPHLIDRWDCISVDEKIVAPAFFREIEAAVKAKDQRDSIRASEFEILTATAFEIFCRENVDIGVIEVGLGGRYDATNVLQHPSITVITKIGEDHQSLLGDTEAKIAYQKAGIMKPYVPCLVDGSNKSSVIEVLRSCGRETKAASVTLVPQQLLPSSGKELQTIISGKDYEPHQLMNIQLAYEAVKSAIAETNQYIDVHLSAAAVKQTSWPGRLQIINPEGLMIHKGALLLDGAHNLQSAEVLGSYVDLHLRSQFPTVTWLIGLSANKDAQQILRQLLRPGDSLVAFKFGPVEGMPWVQPMEIDQIMEATHSLYIKCTTQKACGRIGEALQLVAETARGGPIVIAGSLYLVSDLLRYQRELCYDE